MQITEIYKSLQGESTYAGLACVFVRLTGCNLRCTWCDTAYAFHGGNKMAVSDILRRVDELAGRDAAQAEGLASAQFAKVPLVELTGGEPLLQQEPLIALAAAIFADGTARQVQVETSGTITIKRPINNGSTLSITVPRNLP